MVDYLLALFSAVRVYFRSRSATALKFVALRQQLAVLQRKRPRPLLNSFDRLFWIAVRRFWSGWKDALLIVTPETVIVCSGLALAGIAVAIWRRLGRPKVTQDTRELMWLLAEQNAGWGARKIHGELLKLGFEVSERSISRYLRRVRRRGNPARSWLIFLQNHRETMVASTSSPSPTVTLQQLLLLRHRACLTPDPALHHHSPSHGRLGPATLA